jgi:hypothetical protein
MASPPTIARPWHAALSILAEQVARGVKPLASLTVIDAPAGEPEAFMRAFDRARLGFARKIYWSITPEPHGQTVYVFYDELVWQVYQDATQLPNSPMKHALIGLLFGYNMDDVLSYIKFNHQ